MKQRSTPSVLHFTRTPGFAASALMLAALAAAPLRASAVTIAQKWHAGDKLNYDMSLDGTISLDTDAAAPFIWAGLPLDVDVTGNGGLNLETRSVNAAGAGLVAVRLPQLKMTGLVFDQRAEMNVNGGKTTFTLNGAPTGPKNLDANFLIQPNYALEIGENGRIQRIVPLADENGAPGGAAPAPGDATAPAATGPNVSGLMLAAILQALPAPWPDGDVPIGGTWSVTPRLPIPAAPAATGATDPAMPRIQLIDLGKFDMTLKGEETVDGHKTLRVGIDGLLEIDKDKADLLNNAGGKLMPGAKLIGATQKVSGDLWFDADAGELVKAALLLKGQFKASGVTPARAENGTGTTGERQWRSTQGFSGTLKLLLHETPGAVVP